MYLKSIEVQGFKSFANKTRFEFHNGITCIVGPNGSGKSNVADAVRWVLGEQSAKQLRGASMQDVIFSGTETRKPQSYAYVAITLDNSDHSLNIAYDEVTVARRVYRSGESEYLMNGTTCRLRDVQELFYDTGIGKEGYSIIGQGQIDKILSSKPEDRRELFDEAAGIVKFKRRKNTALKRLDNEHQNLVRVRDILLELEKQVGPLERQSKAAREYLRLKESLKFYEVHTFLLDYAQSDKLLKQVEEQIAIVTDEFHACEEEKAKLIEQYEWMQALLDDLSTKMEEEKGQQNQCLLDKNQMEGQINVLTEQISSKEKNEESLRIRIEEKKSEIAAKEEELAKIVEKKETYEAERARIREQFAEVSGKLEEKNAAIQELDSQIESNKGKIIERLNDKSAFSANLQRYRTILEQNQIRKGEIVQKLLRLSTEEEIQKKELTQLTQSLEECKAKLSDIQSQMRQRQDRLEVLFAESRENAGKISKAQQDYHASHTKAESIRNLAERYEGYGGSIRRIMEVKKQYSGICGVVADLLKVDKKYEVAIETALGGNIQNIVTETEETAKQLIEFLKKNKFGRATFLPLDGIVSDREFGWKNALKEPGIIGLASDLVRAEGKYAGLIQYLLGRVVVADNIDHALAVARKNRHSFRIVTLEGELLNAGGSMTGGAFKNSSNLLGRKREIEELEKKAKEALALYDSLLLAQKTNEDTRKKLEIELEQLRETINEVAIQKNTAEVKVSQAEQKLSEISEDRGDCQLESRQIEEQIVQIKAREKEVEHDIHTLEQENTDSELSVSDMTASLEDFRADREQLEQQVSQVQIRLEKYHQTIRFEEENRSRVQEEWNRAISDKKTLEAELFEDTDEVDAKQEAILHLQEEILLAEENYKELGKSILALQKEKEEKTETHRMFFQKREELTDKNNKLDKELFRLNNQKEKLENHSEELVSYLWNEYELMPSEAAGSVTEFDGTLAEAKKETTALKSQIRNLGPVNVNAIDEYKEVSERYTFMNAQYEDLVSAEEDLKKIIDELEEGMRKQFTEQFANIQREFDRVFKELFGGGKGTLELTEEEDVIDAGIRIIAQPPGKKLQNMMQLSGGEKALTAISLLFAIQNLKPSPFCLLDEIEAALDDANVGRFADYLANLTNNTQFILISHRRGTMNSADRLYGITMQEKGVSALVSVNLVEQDLDQ